MHGSTRLEVIWTVVPVVFLAAIGAFIFYKLPGIKDPPNAQAADSTRVLVEGHQFFWQFRYPNGAISIDRMVAPADEVVNEDITAPLYDVIHSWWVPDFGGKYDAIPGRSTRPGSRRRPATTRRAATSSAGSSTPRCSRPCTSCRARSTTRS